MKLLDGGRAPNPRRVRIFLAEKGVAVPLVPVDLGNLEHKSEAFGAINPMHRVPVLIFDDGTKLAESVAICRYFEALHPEPPLFGSGPLGSALVEMWNRRMELELLFAVAQVFRHGHPKMGYLENPQIARWADANRPRVMKRLAWLNEELATRPFVAGGAFTIADITGFVATELMKPAKLTIPESFGHLLDWRDRIRARPSANA